MSAGIKHSPGPFTLMDGMPTNVLASDGTRIARCDFDGNFDHPECAANARLFSAADALLASCIQVESETPDDDYRRDGIGVSVFMTWEGIDALREAIAKAVRS
jgi:hypothetical protein